MIFATKIFSLEELIGHSLTMQQGRKKSSKSRQNKKEKHNNSINKLFLDEARVLYIKYLIEKYFVCDDTEELWKNCHKAISRILRELDKKKKSSASSQMIFENSSYQTFEETHANNLKEPVSMNVVEIKING